MLSLIKHPLVHLGLARASMREAAETIELVALRGGAGRPALRNLGEHFEARWEALNTDRRNAAWFDRIDGSRLAGARDALQRLERALTPLYALVDRGETKLRELTEASIVALETLGRDERGIPGRLYTGNAGEKLAEFLRSLVAATVDLTVEPADWPTVFDALLGSEIVKPRTIDDSRVAIWGTLEARLQSVDTLILGGLVEGSWPGKARGDRFLSRVMRNGINLEPPEREIGLAAHDFQMAMGGQRVILSRASRSGDAPAAPSRWLQRLTTFIGGMDGVAVKAIKAQGDEWLKWARELDFATNRNIPRAEYAPPLEARPRKFSVTEIETLRRDPYAVYARRILKLQPVEPLIRDPAARERGTLFHHILDQYIRLGIDPNAADAIDRMIDIGKEAFAKEQLPPDVYGVWWPRFLRMAQNFIVEFERPRAGRIASSHTEARAHATEVAATGVTLSGSADRIDLLSDGGAEIIDYKTGHYPSAKQARTLIAPQLPLEAALLKRGAFQNIGAHPVEDLLYVRLKSRETLADSIVTRKNKLLVQPDDLGDLAWERLEELLEWFANPENGYRSRMLPFKESEMDGDYDHLARVLEWSAGAEDEDEFGSGE